MLHRKKVRIIFFSDHFLSDILLFTQVQFLYLIICVFKKNYKLQNVVISFMPICKFITELSLFIK